MLLLEKERVGAYGVNGLGLTMMALPIRTAGKTLASESKRGKFHGDVFVLNYFGVLLIPLGLRFFQGEMVVEKLDPGLNLDGAKHARLASLFEEELDHLLVAVVNLLVALDGCFAFSPCRLLPGCVGFIGGSDRVIYIIMSSNWDIPELLLGRWVDTVAPGLGCSVLTLSGIFDRGVVEKTHGPSTTFHNFARSGRSSCGICEDNADATR